MSKSFSTIDIIIIVLVLVVLAALFLPTFIAKKQNSYRMHCHNNLMQIGTGLALYSSDTYYGQLPIHGPKSALYDNGNGIIGDEMIFVCTERALDCEPDGNYLRDFTWELKKPDKVIAGDNMPNHNYEVFVFLFGDGHGKTTKGNGEEIQDVKNISGAYDPNDCMYKNDFNEDITPTNKYTFLSIRD
jgi:hypothetical protein